MRGEAPRGGGRGRREGRRGVAGGGPRKSQGPLVHSDDFGSFEAMVKAFLRASGPAVRAAKRGRCFRPKPTRSTRKRMGKAMERRKARQKRDEKKR